MNSEYISRSLCFHGQPMQKIWEDERGAGDLQQWGVPQHSNYTVYLERQKYFTFQDRAKRLKLHQFFSRKAIDLYDINLHGGSLGTANEQLSKLQTARPYIANMPPFEVFVNKNQDKFKRLHCLLEGLKPGDVIFGIVTKSQQPMMIQAPLMIKPLCTGEPLVRYLGDVTIKASIPHSCIKVPVDKKGKPRSYLTNDFVCCEIVDVSIDADRLNLTMESAFSKNKNVKFGLVSAEELPEYYRSANNNALEKYNDCLLKSKEFLNPNYDILFELNGLDVKDTFTLMGSLKNPFPVQEYAKELRQTQASKWAFRSVAEGIEHFKIGRHIEAFQCLNKALHIDPRNVEGLVARGALYANKGSFLKAVDDFEKALKLNAYHVNARKYMGETLVALGRSYEDDNRIEDAVKAYRDCLNIIPNHEQARLSLEALQHRPGTQLFDNLLNIPGSSKQKKKRQDHASTSSSDESGSESESNSDSDSSEKSRNHTKKDISLSPLSKRMAQSTSGTTNSAANNRNQFSQPFYMASQNSTDSNTLKNPNDFRLDDDDTESRVRKLLQEASKYKKEKSKKSKKKKSKKSKKESRKDKDKSEPVMVETIEQTHFKDALHALSGLKNENKQNENLQLYEQTLAEIKKRKEIIQPSTSTDRGLPQRPDRKDSPPPKAPSMKIKQEPVPPPPPSMKAAPTTATIYPSSSSYTAAKVVEPPRFSFTIKRPVKVDKFGLVRIATPLTNPRSPTKSRSRSRSRSSSRHRRSRRSHSRSRSRSRYSRSRDSSRYRRRSRSRSSSIDRRRRRRSVSRPRGRYNRSRPSRSRSRSARRRFDRRRRTPSPFVPRGTPSPRRHSRDRDRTRTRSPRRSSPRSNFGNRVWQRPGYKPGDAVSENERWAHDKYSENKPEEGPSIEEIDEIINRAQKERKEEIIKRDKNILKKQC